MEVQIRTEFNPGDYVIHPRGTVRKITAVVLGEDHDYYDSVVIANPNGINNTLCLIEVGEFESRYRRHEPTPRWVAEQLSRSELEDIVVDVLSQDDPLDCQSLDPALKMLGVK